MVELSQELLAEIVRRLVDALHPVGIYLFGSHASGNPHKDSDVDLLVVVEAEDEPNAELEHRGHMSLWGLCVPVDLIVCTVADMEKWSEVPCNLLHTVAQKGRLVYAAGG
jgi:predicted nucleotidyltransferase